MMRVVNGCCAELEPSITSDDDDRRAAVGLQTLIQLNSTGLLRFIFFFNETNKAIACLFIQFLFAQTGVLFF